METVWVLTSVLIQISVCVGEWQRGSLWIFVCARCSSYPLYIPAGHQTAKVHHLMAIKILCCLSLFLAFAPALPSPPLMCYKLRVWQPQPWSVFARMIHQSPMQTLCFWVVCPIKKRGQIYHSNLNYIIIPQKKVLAFVLWLRKEKRKLIHRSYSTVENVRCSANAATQRIWFVQIVCSIFPSFLFVCSSYSLPTISVESTWRCALLLDRHALYGFLLKHCIDWNQRGHCGAVCRRDSL